MRIRNNPLAIKLKNFELQIGFWMGMVNPISAEIIGQTGFDFATLDMEHSAADLKDVVIFSQILRGFNTQLLVRPTCIDPHLVQRIVDAGAQNIMVPMISTADEAEMVVAATRYSPSGTRGFIAGNRANGYGGEKDYISAYAGDIAIIAQIETTDGLNNIEHIARVPGISCLFIGALDLSMVLGYGGSLTSPQFQKQLFNAISRARATGLPVGMFAATNEMIHGAISNGVTFLAIGNDHSTFARALESLRENALRIASA